MDRLDYKGNKTTKLVLKTYPLNNLFAWSKESFEKYFKINLSNPYYNIALSRITANIVLSNVGINKNDEKRPIQV